MCVIEIMLAKLHTLPAIRYEKPPRPCYSAKDKFEQFPVFSLKKISRFGVQSLVNFHLCLCPISIVWNVWERSFDLTSCADAQTLCQIMLLIVLSF